MSVLKILMSVLILFMIPELLGLLIIRFIKKEKNNIVLAFIVGYLIEFAIAQSLAVPMIIYEVSFTTLLKTYVIIISILSVISFFINIIRIKEIIQSIIQSLKETPKFLSLITIILVAMQIYAFIGYAHIDDDDAYYVGTATTTIETDALFKYAGTTGLEKEENVLLRYRLGPFPIYSAIISKLINIHPAIVSHVVFPIIFIPIIYMIYGLIANELFKKEKKSVFLFLIILNIIYIWGNYSIRNNFTFMLFRIWQGKAILANMIIPAVWLFLLKAEETDFKFSSFILLFILNLAGTFTTTMGIALTPIVLMVLVCICEISKFSFKNYREFKLIKSLKNIAICLITCIPSIVYGITYYLGT